MKYFWFVLDLPFIIAMKLTVQPVSEKQYWKVTSVLAGFFGPMFMWFCIHRIVDMTYVYYALPVACGLSFLLLIALPWDGKYPSWNILLTTLGVATGLFWTYIIIEILIDILNGVGIILNLEKTYLGLTILAIGNALPDAFTTISIANQGYGVLAISGGYAGQLFGYLIGFGVAMLKETLIHGPQRFDIYSWSQLDKNLLNLIVLWFSALTLSSTFVYAVFNGFKMDKFFGYVLFFYYFMFIGITTTYAAMQATGYS